MGDPRTKTVLVAIKAVDHEPFPLVKALKTGSKGRILWHFTSLFLSENFLSGLGFVPRSDCHLNDSTLTLGKT